MHTLTVDFGNGVVAGTGAPVRILDYDGLLSLTTQANLVENAMLDGGYVASMRASTRRLTFELDFGDLYGWADLSRLFPHGQMLSLTIARDGRERVIEAYRDGDIGALGGGGPLDPVMCQISLVAPEPYFNGPDAVLTSTVQVTSGLTYPITFAPSITYESLSGNGSSTLAVDNPGDQPVGFVFDFMAAAASSLTITSDGQTMEFAELAAGQRLTIDTARQIVRVDGANGFALLQSGPFLRLPAGHGEVHITGAIGIATLSFTPVFEGV